MYGYTVAGSDTSDTGSSVGAITHMLVRISEFVIQYETCFQELHNRTFPLRRVQLDVTSSQHTDDVVLVGHFTE